MRATRVGRDTALARIVELVRRAQGTKAPIQRLADRIAEVFVPAVLLVAAGTFVVWFAFGPEPRLTLALTAFIGVVVIACPCAMGLATPTAIMVGTGRGAEAGILIRGGEALETAHRVDTVVFDKTGTLTLGRPTVTDVVAAPGVDGARASSTSPAPLETRQRAPARRGDRAPGARATSSGSAGVDGFEAVVGRGVRGTVATDGGGRARSSSAAAGCSRTRGIDLGAARATRSAAAAADGRTVGRRGRRRPRPPGSSPSATRSRPSRPPAVRELTRRGHRGRGWSPATRGRRPRPSPRQVGIPAHHVVAEVLPADKAGDRRARSRPAAGPSPWSATASTTPRPWPGPTSASPSAPAPTWPSRPPDVTLVGGDPRGVPAAIGLSRATMTVVRQNLFWAFAYNVAAHPGRDGRPRTRPSASACSPALAAGAMALSSVSVVANSLRLRGYDARPDAAHDVGRPRGRSGALRDAWFLGVVALAALGVAGGVLAADRWHRRRRPPRSRSRRAGRPRSARPT